MNMSRRRIAWKALAAGGVAGLAGCVPLPSTTPVFPEMAVEVVDARTRQPVTGAVVEASRAGYRRTAPTDACGRCTVPAASQWHFLVYAGSPGVAPTPWHLAQDDPCALTIHVSAPGRVPAFRTFEPSATNPLVIGLPDPMVIPLEDESVDESVPAFPTQAETLR